MIRGNAVAPNGKTQYHARIGLREQDFAIKGLVVCYVVTTRPIEILHKPNKFYTDIEYTYLTMLTKT